MMIVIIACASAPVANKIRICLHTASLEAAWRTTRLFVRRWLDDEGRHSLVLL